MFRLTRQEQFIIGVLVLLVAALIVGMTVARGPSEPGHRVEVALNTASGNGVERNEQPETKAPTLVVHVVGAVVAPGTYELAVGARVQDAVGKAMPTSEADLDALNLAAKLVDGEKIVVPAKGDGGPRVDATSSQGGAGGLVDLNTATATELDTLPGIGPARGADIVAYRQQHPFRRIEDVMDVPGIGPGIFEKIKDRITVR